MRIIVTVKDSMHINRLDLICKANLGVYNDYVLNKIVELNPDFDFFHDGVNIDDKIILPDRSEIYGS